MLLCTESTWDNPGYTFCALYKWAEGAADRTVVKVVVNDRTDGAGDENVLPSPPPQLELIPPHPVAIVPAFEYAASETVVSALVEIVGVVDLAWLS